MADDYCKIDDEDITAECPYYFMGCCGLSRYERCPIDVEREFRDHYLSDKRVVTENKADISDNMIKNGRYKNA